MLIMPYQKGVIKMLMESIAQGYAPQKVRVNSIAPGTIKTKINKLAWKNESALKKLHKLIPYKRIGIPEDIGAVTAWLASDESEYTWHNTIC